MNRHIRKLLECVVVVVHHEPLSPSELLSAMFPVLLPLLLVLFLPLPAARAQAISTSMPVPPLQWLNITGLLQGTSAPPTKYPSIGYDDASRTLLLFGGESSSGIPTAQTFLSVLSLLLLTRSPPPASISPPTRGLFPNPSQICPRRPRPPGTWPSVATTSPPASPSPAPFPLLSSHLPLQSPCPSSPRRKGHQRSALV